MIIAVYSTQLVTPGKQTLEVSIPCIRKWFKWWIAHTESALPGFLSVQLGTATHPCVHKHTLDTQTRMCLAEKDVCVDVNEMFTSPECCHDWPDTKIHYVLRAGFDKYTLTYTNFTLLNRLYLRQTSLSTYWRERLIRYFWCAMYVSTESSQIILSLY